MNSSAAIWRFERPSARCWRIAISFSDRPAARAACRTPARGSTPSSRPSARPPGGARPANPARFDEGLRSGRRAAMVADRALEVRLAHPRAPTDAEPSSLVEEVVPRGRRRLRIRRIGGASPGRRLGRLECLGLPPDRLTEVNEEASQALRQTPRVLIQDPLDVVEVARHRLHRTPRPSSATLALRSGAAALSGSGPCEGRPYDGDR